MLHFCPVYSADDDEGEEEVEAGFYYKRWVAGIPGGGGGPCGPPCEHGTETSDTDFCFQLEAFIPAFSFLWCLLDFGISGWDLAGYIAGGSD